MTAPCIHDRFARACRTAPDAIAIRHGALKLTFGVLNQLATRCARRLRQHRVGPETVVGLCGTRSPELVAGLLGILQAGGAYAPIDPAYPPDRVRSMLEGSRISLVLTASNPGDLTWLGARTRLNVLDDEDSHDRHDVEPLPAAVAADNIALVVHTSGSAGRPKTVAIPHRALAARMRDCAYQPGDVVCQKASMMVVAHISDLLMPIAAGATAAIVDEATIRDPLEFARAIERHAVTRIMLVPSQLRALLERDDAVARLQRLQVLAVSGEAMTKGLVAELESRLPHVSLVNGYSLSEASGLVATSEPGGRTSLALRRAVSGISLHVLDRNLSPVSRGKIGELCVAGEQMARGYLDRPALTAERFVADPFGAPGSRLYRTGDMVRRRADGTIAFAGRRDLEVKVRGFRVDISDVEQKLQQHPAVEQAAVVLNATGIDARLAAYVVLSKREQQADMGVLRAYLRTKLPEHMIPASIEPLECLPLLPNGKIDRVAISTRPLHPVPRTEAPGEPGLESGNETAKTLARIWSEVLGAHRMAGRDNFFDLGGDSLSAMRILARVARDCRVNCVMQDLLDHPTLYAFAGLIEQRLHALPAV